MAKTKDMKPETSVVGALIYADWLTDHGRYQEAMKWREIALVQQRVMEIFSFYGPQYTPTACRKLRELQRTRVIRLNDMSIIRLVFRPNEIDFEYERRMKSDVSIAYAHSHVVKRRKTIYKHGIAETFRLVAIDLVEAIYEHADRFNYNMIPHTDKI